MGPIYAHDKTTDLPYCFSVPCFGVVAYDFLPKGVTVQATRHLHEQNSKEQSNALQRCMTQLC